MVVSGSTPPAALRAFTLIELLIVVGIIAILAAVAVPNFIVARDRARVARVRADHRALATALESYRIDQIAQVYPSANSQGSLKWLCWLTTPIAYLASVNLEDPFTGATAIKTSTDWNLSYTTYRYYAFNEMGYLNAASADGTVIKVYAPPGTLRVFFYCLFSHGPDRVRSKASNGKTFLDDENLFFPDHFSELIYDPSNGTVSIGEILRSGGQFLGRAAPAMKMVQ